MNKIIRLWGSVFLLVFTTQGFANSHEVSLSVWANEAIVSAYTYDYNNVVARQKATAKYFSSKAWINYSQALLSAGLFKSVKDNKYTVSAVATLPPRVSKLGLVAGNKTWQVVMPVMVVYKNPQYQQKQYLTVTLKVIRATPGSGTRGLAITQFVSKKMPPPKCEKQAKKTPG